MGMKAAARAARCAALMVLVAGALSAFGASVANAQPGIGLAPWLPVSGSFISLACANPANAGLTGKVLEAAHVTFGGALPVLRPGGRPR
jgi:hypothetical protein